MATVNSVIVINTDQAEKNVKDLTADVKKMFDTMNQGAAQSTRQMKQTSSAVQTLGRQLAALVGIQTVKNIFNTSTKLLAMENAMIGVAGSAEKAREELSRVDAIAQQLGIDVFTLEKSWVKFRAAAKPAGLEMAETELIFRRFAETARVLSFNAGETEGMFRALRQMLSKGKVQAEELRGQLGEHLPGAFEIAAQSMGMTTAEMDKMLIKGELMAQDLLPRMADALDRTYGSGLQAASQTAQAEFQRLQNDYQLMVKSQRSGIEDIARSFAGGLRIILASAEVVASAVHTAIQAGVAGWITIGETLRFVWNNINKQLLLDIAAVIPNIIHKMKVGAAEILISGGDIIRQYFGSSTLFDYGVELSKQLVKSAPTPANLAPFKQFFDGIKAISANAFAPIPEAMEQTEQSLEGFMETMKGIMQGPQGDVAAGGAFDLGDFVAPPSPSQAQELMEQMFPVAALAGQLQRRHDLIKANTEAGSELQKMMIERNIALYEKDYEAYVKSQDKKVEKTKTVQTQMESFMEDFATSLDTWERDASQAFIDAFSTGGASFKDFAESVIRELGRMAVQALIVKPIFDALRVSMGLPVATNAKGNVYDAGNVVPFAKGGVVSSPTVFPMAKGGIGLMGEAGPEAIMPLSRGKGGKLGVSAPPMNVTVNNMAAGAEVQTSQDKDGGLTIDVVMSQLTQSVVQGGNDFANALEGSYSLGRGRATY